MRARVAVVNRRDGGWWWRLPVVALLWIALAVPIAAAGVVAVTLRRWARDLPEVPDLAAWQADAPQTSLVLAADGAHLAELPFRDGKVIGHRTRVALDRLPAQLVRAVLAAEDVRFFAHRGVDYPAIARAARINYQAGRVVEGASTITQQVARNLLPREIGSERNVRRKVREALLARAIERRWTKRDILETYLDFVFLGEGAYGMAAAARAYFDRDVSQLDLPEAALLAGLIQAPGRLDPFHHPAAARARRDEVLARMARAHLIDAAEQARAAAAPLALARPRRSYGRRAPWYTEQVRRLLAGALPRELARGGLVIDTAALPALGAELAADAAAHADRWGGAELAALVWDHRTGYVEAIVGGRAWGADRFDRALQSCRQPGSAWKPLVYGAALAAGAITPGTALRDAPIAEYDEATGAHWKPRSGSRFRGLVLAQDAFAASLNAPAIDVFDRVGAGPVIALARRLGITTALSEARPMALGASCVRPIELARAYAAIARRGWAVTPHLAIRVRRGDAAVFDTAVPEDPWIDPARRFDRIAATAGADPAERVGAPGGRQGGRLIDEQVAFQLADMMSAVVARGTATGAAALGRPAAGKTGTTNDNTDAWFVGFTGRVLGAVWVGFDDPAHKLGPEGDGAHAALPLWIRAVRAAEGSRPPSAVPGPPPDGMERAAIDRETGLLAAPGTGGLPLWFRPGTAPTEVAGQPGTSPTDFGRSSSEF
ncbi:MAG TPA: transglycosylase domain-containing protein [Kofleriaceae bacterium]|jgi:penicillin-binding protein 1A|nr:transglycosylase domain-containing protein [Kofleriaceae bacterium]